MASTRNNILIVDDLPDWRKTLSGLLVDVGYGVQTAESSARALALLENNNFDLAVIDLRLDESNEDDEGGLDLAVEIKQRWPNVKIIIVTGYGTPARIKRAIEPDPKTGRTLADDYIPKTETDKLALSVQRILSR